MRQDNPSVTAWAVAVRRAVHQLVDRPLVLEDPLALRLVGETAAREAFAREQAGGDIRRAYSRALRALIVGRSRFAEDCLAAAVDAGLRQCVVLGAGLDTLGCRAVHAAAGLRVFEVDHPATQAWKRGVLAAAGVTPPPSLSFVPVDFEHETPDARLRAAGFDSAAPAFFSWLGVVPYLTPPAFHQTLAFLGRSPGGHVVFDYCIGTEELPPAERMAFHMLARRVAAAGEPFRLFVPPAQMHGWLDAAGFTRMEDLSGDQINRRYFAGRSDELRVMGRLGRFLHAHR